MKNEFILNLIFFSWKYFWSNRTQSLNHMHSSQSVYLLLNFCLYHFVISAICYEILYKNVFNLPDVEYAVEIMLHGIDEEDIKKYKYDNELYANHILLNDGRKFELDRPGMHSSPIIGI